MGRDYWNWEARVEEGGTEREHMGRDYWNWGFGADDMENSAVKSSLNL